MQIIALRHKWATLQLAHLLRHVYFTFLIYVLTFFIFSTFFYLKNVVKSNEYAKILRETLLEHASAIIRLHHYMVKTIVFVIIIIIIIILCFFSLQTKFIGQTRNLYRYGLQVDLRTLTQFQ